MCVHPMHCQGGCSECLDDADRKRRKEAATRKMLATRAAKRAASHQST